MFNQFKKFISLILCAGLLNACVLPSTALFAAKSPITKKQQAKKPVAPKAEEQEDSDEEKPTISETWQKVINCEWKELTKADGWNIVKSAGALFTLAVAYKLFKSKPDSGNNPDQGPRPDMPDDKPNSIPAIPTALQNIINNDLYGPEDKQKIKDLCNNNYMKQLETKGFPNLQDQLLKEIKQTSNQAPENIKRLIDGRHQALQNHLKKKNITNTPSAKEEKKPQSLYPFADQAHKQMVPVVKQRGASCGYHSILNAALSIRGIHENQANEIINAKFAQKDGLWRAPMVQNRKKALVKNYIKNLIHTCMILNTEEEQTAWNNAKAEWDATGWFYRIFCSAPIKPRRKLTDNERRALDRIANAYAHAFVLDENLNILQENPADLENQLQQIIRQDRPDIKQAEVDGITQCIHTIDLTELPTKIAHANILMQTACTYASGSNLETDLYADNLNTEEMEVLKDIVSEEYGIDNDTITIIDNTHLLKTEAYQGILTDAKEYMRTNDCMHSFCVRTRINSAYNHQEVEQLTTIIHNDTATQEAKNKAELRLNTINDQLHADTGSTHWISITLDRKNGQNTYLIKDSMGGNYTNHITVKQLIEALEQPNMLRLEQAEEFDIISDEETANSNSITDNNNAPTDTDNAATDDTTLTAAQALTNALDNIMNNQSNPKTNGAKTTHTNAQKEIVAIPQTPSANPQKIASIQTLAQIGNSCAYHALKNGNDILRILKTPQIQDMEDNFDFEAIAERIGNNLCCDTSKTKVTTLFNEIEQKEICGEWRQIIKTKRLPDALKESIYNKLLQSIPRAQEQITRHDELITIYEINKAKWDERKQKRGGHHKEDPMPYKPMLPLSNVIDGNVRSCFRNIAHACATHLADDNNTIVLTDTAHLPEILVNIVRITNPALLQDREEIFNDCITLLNADELAKNFGEAITAQTAMRNNGQRARELIGNDLDGDELHYLLDHGNIENVHDISIIARIEASEFAAGNSYALLDILPHIKDKMLDDTCSHAFLIRSGFSKEINHFQDEINQSNNGTHWICVVLYRVNGNNHYIIADSLNNNDSNKKTTALNKNYRTTDDDVNYLIAMLDS